MSDDRAECHHPRWMVMHEQITGSSWFGFRDPLRFEREWCGGCGATFYQVGKR